MRGQRKNETDGRIEHKKGQKLRPRMRVRDKRGKWRVVARKSVRDVNRERQMRLDMKVRGKRSGRTQRVMAPKGTVYETVARCVTQTDLKPGRWRLV